MKTKLIIIAVIAIFGSAALQAQVAYNEPLNRGEGQRNRIHQGVRSGELNRSEAHRLKKEQRHIRNTKCRAKADGRFTKGERRHINHEQRKADKDIYRLKHNDRERRG
ncbi:MAG TPA: hypothetical protein VK590_14470 [Saprospiraceae bacterium]|nr:hypothetical protein [Saprospiraceae bacterium]